MTNDMQEVARIISLLGEAGYMDWSSKAADLRRTKAIDLLHGGIDHMMVAVLWKQAQKEAHKNASGLFAAWMKSPKLLDASLRRLRQRNAFQAQAVKEVHRDERIAEQDAEMTNKITRLTDWKRDRKSGM